jgi:PAS domain S-box-containing protein
MARKPETPAEAYLTAIVASSDDAIVAHDLDATITLWNPAAEQLLGYPAAEAIGASTLMLFPPDRHAEEIDTLRRLWSRESVPHFESVLRTRDGRLVDVSLTVSPIVDTAGAVVGASKIIRDMRDRKVAETAQQRLAALVQSSDDAIVSKDLNGIVMSWNPAAERLFGYSAEEMIGESITRIIPDERLGEEAFVLGQVRAGRRVDHFETVRQTKSGESIDISLTVSPIRDAKGRVVGASKIARDITRQKRLIEAQRTAEAREEAARRHVLEVENRRVQEGSRLKSEFVANMSHELRTPLNSIIGFAEMMADARMGPLPARYTEFARLIHKSAQHLLQLINDILDLAKVESGRIDMKPEHVDLVAIVNDVTSIAAGFSTPSKIRIEVSIDPEVRHAYLDPTRLKQVLYNYLSNAIKFSPENGHVAVRVRPEDGRHFRLEVEDWGIGVRPEDLDRLFVEFQQLDATMAKPYPGTGLGLALTKRIVEAQGGSVGVRTEPGKGSTFFATLPRIVTARTAGVTAPEADAVSSGAREADAGG